MAHHLALRAQHTSELNAEALVTAWPGLTTAALRAQSALGQHRESPDRLVERVALDAEAMKRAFARQAWPRATNSDPAFRQVTSALNSAANSGLPDLLPDGIAEAHRLLTSTLWTTSQIASRATSDLSFDVRFDKSLTPAEREEVRSAATDVHRRLDAVEQMAAGALNGSHGLQTPDSLGLRLRHAVAAWDIESHRALLGESSTAVLHVLAHLEAESVKGIEAFVVRAPEIGIIDQINSARLQPILRHSSASWVDLRDASEPLAFASTSVPISFIDAARHLQDTFVSASRSSGPEDARDVIQAFLGHLESSVTVAASACDLIDNGELRAPARAVARLLADSGPGHASPFISPVEASAIYRRETVPLSGEVRQRLSGPARLALDHAHEAVQRASGLDAHYRSITATPANEPADNGAYVFPFAPSVIATRPSPRPVSR